MPLTNNFSAHERGRVAITSKEESVSEKVKSKDGTVIAYDKHGHGPAVVISGGTVGDRSQQADVAQLLAKEFTVFNFDRRGRGETELKGGSCPAPSTATSCRRASGSHTSASERHRDRPRSLNGSFRRSSRVRPNQSPFWCQMPTVGERRK